ncbi:P-loop containing nucleoside triphosphate hydrolase protein [Mycotypha africana]|uniref:P-loop containing nucleoside triphosphate hydrolase protein n=1 Tax=Mycotypha africana TaxID=64632 RepID=UPI0023015BE0|nr:P-loop containing nucleoside triphosphate hydrolase protein [Mycotypha africana]KAI8984391.1 P-loop containing nucleoside triphosphate hydrolase protein [Mycotypha africana]
MSAKGLLEALKEHDLVQYYPKFMQQNIVSLNKLARLPETDYIKLGVLGKDKSKLEALARQYNIHDNKKAQATSPKRAAQQSLNKPSNLNNTTITTTTLTTIPAHSNKRPYVKSPPRNTTDRSKRRMTIAPQTVIPRTLPTPSVQSNDTNFTNTNYGNATPNPRRLSQMPTSFTTISSRKQAIIKSPVRQNQPTSASFPSSSAIPATPKRLTTSPKRYNAPTSHSPQQIRSGPRPAAATATFNKARATGTTVIATNDNVTNINENIPSTRLLDTYGIPIPAQKQKYSSVTSTNPISSNTNNSNNKNKHNDTSINYQRKQQQSSPIRMNNNNHMLFSSTLNPELNQRIRVCVRKRPLNKKEINNQETDITSLIGNRTIQIHAPRTKIDLTPFTETHSFTFDDTFDASTTNEEIYARTAKPLVEYVFTGGKATCFAHGQTGSGKTYTMLDPEHGLYVLAAQDIFHFLEQPEYRHLTTSIGFYEIYQGQLFDLLNKKTKLNAREDGNGNVVIAGLKEYTIENVDQLMQVFDYGNASRTTGKTGANNTSSRSHAVLQICLRYKASSTLNKTAISTTAAATTTTSSASSKIYGKLIFIDLAGSERGQDRGEANTQTRMEGAEINKSLLALKECIRALDQNKSHTPFRGSKLTQVLRDSFTGDSRTCMIATISPNISNSEHTLNTLRYADRVKQLRGESDPRLLNSDYNYNMTASSTNTLSIKKEQQPPSLALIQQNAEDEEMRAVGLEDFEDNEEMDDTRTDYLDNYDNRSLAASSDIWEDAGVSENLFEVDFPVSQTALTTPNNESNRHYSVDIIEPPPTTPRRKAKYMKRLESPPEEVFQQELDAKFFTPPLGPVDDTDDMDDIPSISAGDTITTISMQSANTNKREYQSTTPTSPSKTVPPLKRAKLDQLSPDRSQSQDVNNDSIIGLTGIKKFLNLHKMQMRGLDECLRREREMAEQLESLISKAGSSKKEGDEMGINEEIKEAYEDYLNDLANLTDTKYALLDALSQELKSRRNGQRLNNHYQ